MVEQRKPRNWRDSDDDRFPGQDSFGRGDASNRKMARGWPEDRRRESPNYEEQYGGRAYGYGAGGRGTEDFDQQSSGERRGAPERSLWDRGVDEISSWLGDERAQTRREGDRFRGKGPKNYTRSDERIREDVCDRLMEAGAIDASDIEVQVAQGEVTLSGTVPMRDQRRAAEDCAEHISGVRHVQNNVRVAQAQQSVTNAEQSALAQRPDQIGGAEFGDGPDSVRR